MLKFFMLKSLRSPSYNIATLWLMTIIALCIWLLLRVALTLDVGLLQFSTRELLGILIKGAWFDLATLSYVLVPFIVVSLLLPKALHHNTWVQRMRWLVVGVVTFCLLFGAVAEYIFWQEFSTRFNFIAVDYLIYTTEVLGNIRESYPVPLILSVIALTSALIVFSLRKVIRLDTQARSSKQKLGLAMLVIALPALSLQFANVDQMAFSKNAYANELAGNGLFSFSAAARRNELDYDQFYKTLPQAQAVAALKNIGVNRQLTYALQTPGNALVNQVHVNKTLVNKPVVNTTSSDPALGPFKRRPKNIVLISVESLSAAYLGTYGNQQNLTPYLNRLAGESLVFDRVFATGTRTVRGLDALSIAIPPIPGQAIVHRPNSDHLATIGELLEAQGYATFFIYGGYGVFDSMNNYFRSNDYQVIDRTDFDKATIQSENVWGVDDESLFDNSLVSLDRQAKTQQPFFAHIMTTSNHRPYTYPAHKIDFPQGSRLGAVKYTDYAIGQFIAKAKTKPWFKDTLFVIVADHCASVAGKTKLPIAKYHIPLFFYAPDLLTAGHYRRLASQIDIVPTLLDILGTADAQYFYGQSMFAAAQQHLPERAFVSNYQALGYYKDNTLTVLSPKQEVEAYRVDSSSLEAVAAPVDKHLLNEAIAYYQTAARAYKHGELKEFNAH